MSILAFIIVGVLAGWIAGLIMRGHGFGLIADFVIGIVGAVIGGFLFQLLGVSTYGFVGSLAMAVVGAVVLLAIASALHRT